MTFLGIWAEDLREFCLFFPATVQSFQKLKTAKEIYFGTDYDNQRNGEVSKIASNNDM